MPACGGGARGALPPFGTWGATGDGSGCGFAMGLMFPRPMRPLRLAAAAIAAAALLVLGRIFEGLSVAEDDAEEEEAAAAAEVPAGAAAEGVEAAAERCGFNTWSAAATGELIA